MNSIWAGYILLAMVAFEPGAVRPLTIDGVVSRHPAWSPNGSQLAFTSDRSGSWSLYVLDAQTGRVRAVLDTEDDDQFPAWSPDGERLVFVRTADGDSDLYALHVDRGELRRFPLPGNETFPDWSPRNGVVAFSVGEPPALELRLLDLDSGVVQTVVASPGRHVWPRWSPDGERLAFFSRRDTDGEDDEIYTLRLRGRGHESSVLETGELRRLTFGPGHDFCPTWSPDGTRIVFVDVEEDGARALQVVRSDGTPLERLAPGFYRITEPSWSPDGGMIAFTGRRTESESYRLFTVEVER